MKQKIEKEKKRPNGDLNERGLPVRFPGAFFFLFFLIQSVSREVGMERVLLRACVRVCVCASLRERERKKKKKGVDVLH